MTQVNSKLEALASTFNDDNEKKKLAQEENKAQQLEAYIEQREDLDPKDAIILRDEAKMLNRLADYADNLADAKEKGTYKKLESKNDDEVKEVLMEALGIPAEFVDQLSLMVKAGPDALREAAHAYREEAAKKLEEADFLTQEIEAIDHKIKSLEVELSTNRINKQSEATTLKKLTEADHLNKHWRSNAEIEYKEMLEQAEGVKPTTI